MSCRPTPHAPKQSGILKLLQDALCFACIEAHLHHQFGTAHRLATGDEHPCCLVILVQRFQHIRPQSLHCRKAQRSERGRIARFVHVRRRTRTSRSKSSCRICPAAALTKWRGWPHQNSLSRPANPSSSITRTDAARARDVHRLHARRCSALGADLAHAQYLAGVRASRLRIL